jgi:tRNA threonylcarbamoyladenosine biosynthesis protein TsaB
MHSLYIDSTAGLVIGLLDSDFFWVEYQDSLQKKPSEVIHREIYEMVKKHNLNIKDLNLIVSAGPGSYTGMRLGEGIAQIFAWNQLKVYSFYHFEAPRLSGVENGFWITNAFKGQAFIYRWDQEQRERELVDFDSFKIEDPKLGYTLINDREEFSALKSTKDLIKSDSFRIFKNVLKENLRQEPYYFRTLDEEFKHA